MTSAGAIGRFGNRRSAPAGMEFPRPGQVQRAFEVGASGESSRDRVKTDFLGGRGFSRALSHRNSLGSRGRWFSPGGCCEEQAPRRFVKGVLPAVAEA
jgi:hypothetical protein